MASWGSRGCGPERTVREVVADGSHVFRDWALLGPLCSPFPHLVHLALLGDLCSVSCFWMISHCPESVDGAWELWIKSPSQILIRTCGWGRP